MPLNTTWAIGEVTYFIARCEEHSSAYRRAGDAALHNPAIEAIHDDVIGRMPIIEQIADQAWPEWRDRLPKRISLSWEYEPLLQIAKQVRAILARREELNRNLGEQAPGLSAPTMHPDVWNAARSLWNDGHFGDAVSAAARSVNNALQVKVGRRNLSEAKLTSECFSLDPPKPGVPRLRLMHNDGSDTYVNLHAGALAFGQGCFKAIRNVLAHEYGSPLAEPPEEEALHYLAAFSILARWIDQASVER